MYGSYQSPFGLLKRNSLERPPINVQPMGSSYSEVLERRIEHLELNSKRLEQENKELKERNKRNEPFERMLAILLIFGGLFLVAIVADMTYRRFSERPISTVCLASTATILPILADLYKLLTIVLGFLTMSVTINAFAENLRKSGFLVDFSYFTTYGSILLFLVFLIPFLVTLNLRKLLW